MKRSSKLITGNKVLTALYDATWGRFFYAGLFDWFMDSAERAGLTNERAELVAQATGRVLEIGAGTGLNLRHYDERAVWQLVLTEPYPHMLTRLSRKLNEMRGKRTMTIPSQVDVAHGENLPYPDGSFDTVVATMVLCTADDPEAVLAEIHRVLKPGGKYLFLEHVRSSDPKLARRQDRIQPFWYYFACGCRCNRRTREVIEASELALTDCRAGTIPQAPSNVSPMITGYAVKPQETSPENEVLAEDIFVTA
jgi:SAM-dependent methyltransferase